jgi:hypothetical protein
MQFQIIIFALSDDAISNNNLTKEELVDLSFKKIEEWLK